MSHEIHVRISEDEFTALEEKCALLGITRTDFVLNALRLQFVMLEPTPQGRKGGSHE